MTTQQPGGPGPEQSAAPAKGATAGAAAADGRRDLEARVHTDLPRVRPEDMVTTQPVTPARDPRGGRDTEQEFVLRNAGF